MRLMRQRRIDAVVTVGTGGDKMFWGRLAGWLAGVPVICSALHSTGLPDHVELPNRLLAPLTDAFIAVAEPHGRYLAEHEGCPAKKIRVIPNGVDVRAVPPPLAECGIAGTARSRTRRRPWRASWRRCGRRRITRCSCRPQPSCMKRCLLRDSWSSATGRNARNWKALAETLGHGRGTVRFLGHAARRARSARR